MKSKALFLLVTFLLNTIVGFACAVTMETGHSHSEGHSYSPVAHKHQNSTHQNAHAHSVTKKDANDKAEKHGCCKDEVSKFNSITKIVGQASKIDTKEPVLDLTPIFFAGKPEVIFKSSGYSNYLANRQRPPNSKIRILIQSFQI